MKKLMIVFVLLACQEGNLFLGLENGKKTQEDVLRLKLRKGKIGEALNIAYDLYAKNPSDKNTERYVSLLLKNDNSLLFQEILRKKDLNKMTFKDLSDVVSMDPRVLANLSKALKLLMGIKNKSDDVKSQIAEIKLTQIIARLKKESLSQAMEFDKEKTEKKFTKKIAQEIVDQLTEVMKEFEAANRPHRAKHVKKIIDKMNKKSSLPIKERLIGYLEFGYTKKRTPSVNFMKPADENLIIMGDSVSVGVFSDSMMSGNLSEDSTYQLADGLLFSKSFVDVLKNMDSYYKQFGYGAFSNSKLENSLYHKIKKTNQSLSMIHVGVSGSKVDDLESQFEKLSKKIFDKKNYFVIVIGNNDICGHYHKTEFVRNFSDKLTYILGNIENQFKKSYVFLVPAFDINGLLEYKDNLFSSSFEGLLQVIKATRCDDLQKKLCPLFVGDSRTRLEIIDYRKKINEVLEKTANDKEFERTFYIKSMEDIVLNSSSLAIDCFHPSQKSHQTIADAVFEFMDKKMSF